MAAPRVVASTVSIPAELVLHTDMAPFLFFLPVSNIFLLAVVAVRLFAVATGPGLSAIAAADAVLVDVADDPVICGGGTGGSAGLRLILTNC